MLRKIADAILRKILGKEHSLSGHEIEICGRARFLRPCLGPQYEHTGQGSQADAASHRWLPNMVGATIVGPLAHMSSACLVPGGNHAATTCTDALRNP